MTASGLELRPARVDDVPLLLTFIRELAEAEAFPDPLSVTEDDLRASLFGARPAAEAVLASLAGAPVGFAVFYGTFATSTGRPGLHLDDLYVRPSAQGKGVGRALLAHLGRLAVERGCARLEWWALEWNAKAVAFYEALGARRLDHLKVFRVTGNALERLGSSGGPESR